MTKPNLPYLYAYDIHITVNESICDGHGNAHHSQTIQYPTHAMEEVMRTDTSTA
jgi:hypothetical protein